MILSFAAAPQSGQTSILLTLKFDGSATQAFQLPLTVLPSFAEWAAGLADASPAGDSDADGISNLIEYASGGDNQTNSQFFPNMAQGTRLLPVFAAAPFRLTFLRRTDAIDRGLSYTIESSATLGSGDWQAVAGASVSIISNPGPGIEEVSASLPATTAGKLFFRLRIGLNE